MVDVPFVPSASDLIRWAEALSGIARTGLGFTESLYERERFEEVLRVAADIRYAAVEEAVGGTLVEEWLATVGNGVPGYVTPKCAVAAIVGNEDGEILLTQRADSGVWLYPGRVGRRRLFAVGGRGQGGARGDGHRVRAGCTDRRARRPAPRLRTRSAVLDAVPLQDARWRAGRSSARDEAGRFLSPRPASPTAGGRAPAGSTSRSRPSTGSSCRAASTRPAVLPGAGRPLRRSRPAAARATGRRSTPRRRPSPTRHRSRRGRRAR